MRFSDRLAGAIDRVGAPTCVGLDPDVDRLPDELRVGAAEPIDAIASFCQSVLEAVAPHAGVVKLQSACFERFGSDGFGLVRELTKLARDLGLVTILDAKRGDIGVSARHYAAAGLTGPSGADAITVSPYLGMETIEPFLLDGKGVFVLVRTSNPGSDDLQSRRLADGRTVAELVADQVAALGAERIGACGLSDVGAVVGATKSADGPALRGRMARQFFLVPGFGAQGGGVEDVRPLLASSDGGGGGGVIVNASRSIIFAFDRDAPDWRGQIGDASKAMTAQLRCLRPE